ncbi:MAG: tRNA epoxyqueuosine(34) reductase QueG [Leptospira sp.]|nr:tRNA epoxyqueuosine(34) reductase QueG [Leptospira sp.]
MHSLDLEKIKAFCLSSGFDIVGFTKAEISDAERLYISNWVQSGHHGQMGWYAKENSMEIRLHLKHLGFIPKSVICLGLLYRSEKSEDLLASMNPKVSRYALGEDYHSVLRERAKPLLKYLKQNYPEFHFRQSVDSLPIPEKIFAKQAGIGWMGKNTNLIHPEIGSYFFISTILTDYEWEIPLNISTDHCGSCRACLDACPTGALFAEYQINASLCISQHNIENENDDIPEDISLNGWLYGCDICQEVCPWNQIKAKRNQIESRVSEFQPRGIFAEENLNLSKLLNSEEFDNIFQNTSIQRIGVKKWNRNLAKLNNENQKSKNLLKKQKDIN